MVKKRGRNIIIRHVIIKPSFYETTLFDDKVYNEEITRIIIKSDFDYYDKVFDEKKTESDFDIAFDIDWPPYFLEYPNLREFKIAIKNSNFEVHDGQLYMRLNRRTATKNIGSNCFYSKPIRLFENESYISMRVREGLVLLCCPSSTYQKDIILHKDCTVIYSRAFEGCRLNSITIPDAFMMACPSAFTNLTVKTLYVPNNPNVYLGFFHVNVNKDMVVKCITNDDSSKKNICSLWENTLIDDYV